MFTHILIPALFILSLCSTAHADTLPMPSLKGTLIELDQCLSQKERYDKEKERQISIRKQDLASAHTNIQHYAACIGLYEEYKSYQYDSAYAYATRSLQLATQLDNKDCQVEAGCALVFCMLSAGLYKEAFDQMREIHPDGIGEVCRKKYYELAIRLNYAIADYNHTMPHHDEYIRRGNAYADSLLAILEPQSAQWWYHMGQRQMKATNFQESIESFHQMLELEGIDTHTQAIVHSCLGWMYWQTGEIEKGMSHLAASAMCDVQASVKETTSLCALAELLYTQGDIKRAISYVQLSLDDANFYGARLRKIEIGNILPIIEQSRYELIKRQRNTVIGTIILVSLLAATLAVAFFVLYRQKKKLQEARNLIAENNEALRHTNSQLHEANKIKNEYIGNSFYLNSLFIDKMEKLYKIIDHKVAARQYEDLQYTLRNTMLKEERDNMFIVFDKTFLKIFPHFVEQYNELFPPEERKLPSKGDLLTTEMRIFALIRLGVTESEKIAQFLNKSIHTINTYKTRVKNKSNVENEAFEKQIMQIGRVQ